MKMITIYNRPKDFPDEVIAREYTIEPGRAIPGDIVSRGDKVSAVRMDIEEKYPYMVFLFRSHCDEPHIVGVYL